MINRKSILTALLSAAVATSVATAQTVEISPAPRNVTWGAEAFARPAGVALIGATDADADAISALTDVFPSSASGISVTIGEKGHPSVAPYADKIPDSDGGYYLSVTPQGVVIAGNNAKGTFYGVQTFLQVASQPNVMSVEVSDYPAGLNRGVVEGFYGNPWSVADRLSQFDFYGANKLDTYIYGPKDDPYHHGRWREPYPDDKAAEMKTMAEAAARNKVWFVWAMHPGNAIVSADDRQAALDKLELMYGLGFRSFAIFFDDISNYSGTNQADYLNYLTDNFVKKHPDVTPMIMCPSQYNRGWVGGSYLSELAKDLYPEVRVMWTGNSVVDMINVSDVEWFKNQLGRDPLIWLNYPVNDYGQHNLLMGPFYGNDVEVPAMVSGFTANPMQYAEASKVALYQLADYLWNPEAYDSDKAWERSISYLMPGHEEAFKTFCINNVDLAPNTHGLRRWGESPAFKAIIDSHPLLDAEARALYRTEFEKIAASGAELLSLSQESALVAETLEFLKCFELQGRRGSLAMDMSEALEKADAEAFVAAYSEYKTLTAEAEALMSRGYQGSIQRVQPHTATLYVEPFISTTVNNLIADYKDGGYFIPAGLFPAQVVENGIYFIRHQSRYLTNVEAGGKGGYPVFTDELDVVNPDRQAWRIRLDPETGRYSIINLQDERYLNEKGEFTVSDDTNPFESSWHTYIIYRHNGDYAIRNGGAAKNAFWGVEGNRVVKIANDTLGYDRMIFSIEPYASEQTLPMIVDGQTYFIMDEAGRYLTNDDPNGSGGHPIFIETPRRLTSRHQWTFTLDSIEGRVDLCSVADGRYVNEKGDFGTNRFYADWNTYEFYACGDTYAIRNGGSAGQNFWAVSGVRIVKGGVNDMAYLFRVVDATVFGSIDQVGHDKADATETRREYFDLMGRRLASAPAQGLFITKIYRADGSVESAKTLAR
ncbi:MAG: beta-N-acetylglucosaminidase domain-containing protein [Pseudoflavonifractor sp.]|nr:beta-N-acetylglucosaminidase domain-containing protein [Alloprevotella sp.]MCM1116749.1 beta-N-acetylglucosaminidase domain-containing protein [Pseudoflavonifractor sp.]